MIKKNTEDALGVFWDSAIESPGITLYGLFDDENIRELVWNQDVWPSSISRPHRLYGDGWSVALLDVKVFDWPPAHKWRLTIELLLNNILQQGAILAWAAVDGDFVDPPWLFHPEHMGFGTWDLKNDSDIFFCSAMLGKQFRPLSSEVIVKVRQRLVDKYPEIFTIS